MKTRIAITAEIEDGNAIVLITTQRGRRAKVTRRYTANIIDYDKIDVDGEEGVTIDRAILIRKAIRAALND